MIDWHLLIGIVSGILAAVSVIPYIKDILHGSTRPNVVSWFLWTLLLLISILAQMSAGASWSVIFLIGDFVGTFSIFWLCLIGYGYRQYGYLELSCLTLAIVAIISWQLTGQPILAIVLSIVADIMASVPTVVKAYLDPWSEHSSTWLIIAGSSVLAILSTRVFDGVNLLFPMYIFLINLLIGSLSFVGRRIKNKPF